MSSDPFGNPIKHKKYLKIAVFGKGGTGKTRLALSFPKCCVIDTEKGTDPYVGRYDFKPKFANRWRQLEPILLWLKANPNVYQTLVIDSMTVFYMDLIQDIIDYIKNKRGNEIMTNGDWGVEKRRFAAFLNMLTDLPMNVILSFREKDEYVEAVSKSGEDVRKKTGDFLIDADKQVDYLFDISLRCYTEENKKTKSSKFLVTCTKSRYDWLPKYSVHDITSKRAYPELFASHVDEMLDGKDAPESSTTETILVAPEQTTVEKTAEAIKTVAEADPETVKEAAESLGTSSDPEKSDTMGTLNQLFGVAKPDPSQPEAKLEDIKVLMTRANQMVWPDEGNKCRRQNCKMPKHIHQEFVTADGKSLIHSVYGVESSKELRKPQVDFLYKEFGKVLAGLAFLARDEQNSVFVATPIGTTEEEVRAGVLSWDVAYMRPEA